MYLYKTNSVTIGSNGVKMGRKTGHIRGSKCSTIVVCCTNGSPASGSATNGSPLVNYYEVTVPKIAAPVACRLSLVRTRSLTHSSYTRSLTHIIHSHTLTHTYHTQLSLG